MSGVELGLAIIGTLDLCLKYGQIIVTKYKTFNKADEEIEERILAIEAAWAKISQQLAFLKRVWASLDEDYQELQGRILRVLERKLQTAVLQISKLEKGANQTGTGFTDKRKALKYALMVKGSLDKAIQDLRVWEKEFDTTWFLVLRVADHTIDTELVKRPGTEKLSVARHVRDALQQEPQRASSVFLAESKLHSATRCAIPHSTCTIIEIAGVGTFILDSADCSSRKDASTFAKNARHLAGKLQQVDANRFHLLKCYGVVRVTDPSTKQLFSYDFIFNMQGRQSLG